jgi:hypothetical protein
MSLIKNVGHWKIDVDMEPLDSATSFKCLAYGIPQVHTFFGHATSVNPEYESILSSVPKNDISFSELDGGVFESPTENSYHRFIL